MKIMVTGGEGQLGQCLAEYAGKDVFPSGSALWCLSRQQLDITNADAVNATVRRLKPDIVVNAAAWTNVDGAQQDVVQAMAVNALGAANVAAAATSYDCRMIHVSTDYVFDGTAQQPIDESAAPGPINEYGASKLAGEQAVHYEAPDAIIVRTSWLYSVHGNNFLKTILRHGVERRVLDVVDDQTGCPTSASDVAAAIVSLAQRTDLKGGVYHYAGADAMTWFDFARLIVDYAARHDAVWADVQVRPIATRLQESSAPRPAYSVLSCQKASAIGFPLYGPKDRLESLVASILAHH